MVTQRGQATQDIGQVFLRVDPAPATTLYDGVDHRTVPTGIGMADEGPALATNDRRPHIVFDQVVVYYERRS